MEWKNGFSGLQRNKMLLEIQLKDETLYVRDKIVF